MEDQTAGSNFQLVATPGAVGSDGTGTTTVGINPGDTYSFRIRADHSDGAVSDYVTSGTVTAGKSAPAKASIVTSTFKITGVGLIVDLGLDTVKLGGDFRDPIKVASKQIKKLYEILQPELQKFQDDWKALYDKNKTQSANTGDLAVNDVLTYFSVSANVVVTVNGTSSVVAIQVDEVIQKTVRFVPPWALTDEAGFKGVFKGITQVFNDTENQVQNFPDAVKLGLEQALEDAALKKAGG